MVDSSLISALEANRTACDDLELRAFVMWSERRYEEAAHYLQLCVAYAASNHPGWFISPSLEGLAAALGETLPVAQYVVGDLGGPVCHVVTGDASTAVVHGRKWWSADPRARVVAEPDSRDGSLDAALRLRRDLAGASIIVVHGLGDSVVVALALAGWRDRPPVVVVDDPEHRFWLGVACTDLLVVPDITTQSLAVERRCLAPGRTVLVEPFERADENGLQRVLTQLRTHLDQGTPMVMPTALLPARFTGVDVHVVGRQLDRGTARGLAGARSRWPAPAALAERPGWVVVSRNLDATMQKLSELLDLQPTAQPDVLVVCEAADELAGELAGVLAGLAHTVAIDGGVGAAVAAELGRRQLLSRRLLVVSDAADVDVVGLRELETRFHAGQRDVWRDRLPTGEFCGFVWGGADSTEGGVTVPALVMTAHGGSGLRARAAHPAGKGTPVRESSDITEKREELFHTEEIPHGTRSSDHEPSEV